MIPPDLTTGVCITHPESWIWNTDDSTAGDAAIQAPSLLANATVAEAKRLCHQCPVEQPCLEWTMAVESSGGRRSGVVGGLTARERKKLAKGIPLIPPHGSLGRYRLERLSGATCQLCRNTMAKSRAKSRAKLRAASNVRKAS
jgi:Transcription factor WhiB